MSQEAKTKTKKYAVIPLVKGRETQEDSVPLVVPFLLEKSNTSHQYRYKSHDLRLTFVNKLKLKGVSHAKRYAARVDS